MNCVQRIAEFFLLRYVVCLLQLIHCHNRAEDAEEEEDDGQQGFAPEGGLEGLGEAAVVEVGDEADVGEHGEGVDAGAKDEKGFWIADVHGKEQYAKGDLCPKEDEVNL